MKDLHSHYVYGVDDGAKDVDMAKAMLDVASSYGVTDIIFTPHYMKDTSYVNKVRSNKVKFNVLKKYAKTLDINVYLGNEVFINSNMVELLKKKEITTINDSRYLLVEIPLDTKINNVIDILYDLIANGITPILAHPERYVPYQKNLAFFKELVELGVLLQLNISSLNGGYGKSAQKMAKMLLKNRLISFIGSDIHRPHHNHYDDLEYAYKKIRKYAGEEDFIKITSTNFDKVINNEEI